jgi:hypothetical protein
VSHRAVRCHIERLGVTSSGVDDGAPSGVAPDMRAFHM